MPRVPIEAFIALKTQTDAIPVVPTPEEGKALFGKTGGGMEWLATSSGPHAPNHEGGPDPISPAGIGAASASDLVTHATTGANVHGSDGLGNFPSTPTLAGSDPAGAAAAEVAGHETAYDHDDYDAHLAAAAPHTGHAATSHAHSAADVTTGTLDGARLPALDPGKRGGVPATGTPSGKFLRDDDTWAAPGGSGGIPIYFSEFLQ